MKNLYDKVAEVFGSKFDKVNFLDIHSNDNVINEESQLNRDNIIKLIKISNSKLNNTDFEYERSFYENFAQLLAKISSVNDVDNLERNLRSAVRKYQSLKVYKDKPRYEARIKVIKDAIKLLKSVVTRE